MAEILLMRFVFRHDAEFAQGYLHDAGIPARVMSDDPTLPIFRGTLRPSKE